MTTRRYSPRTIEQLIGPIVIRQDEAQPAHVPTCDNVGRWTGEACTMSAEPGSTRCKLHAP